MHPRGPRRALLALAALAGVACAEDKAATKSTSTTSTSTATACVATSTSGSFFDLRPDVAVIADKTTKKNARTEDYEARGWDYGANFTMNICGAVVKGVEDAMGVEKALWKNISAYYVQKGQVFSLGSQSGTLVPRGRKLVLQYKDGSPCGADKSKRSIVREGSYRHFADDDEDDESKPAGKKSKEDDQKPGKGKEDDKDDKDDKDKDKDTDKEKEKEKPKHRKSATISFLCDRDPAVSTAISFVGTDPDECAYFFEVRSQHACAGAEPHKPGSVGPASVFAIIFGITVMVYILGGIFYQRTVAHARGWRQLPNYSLWAGIWNFVKDIFIIITSSCARFLPSRRGYHTLSISPSARNRNREDENRLIDQLDEEWDD